MFTLIAAHQIGVRIVPPAAALLDGIVHWIPIDSALRVVRHVEPASAVVLRVICDLRKFLRSGMRIPADFTILPHRRRAVANWVLLASVLRKRHQRWHVAPQ